MKKLTTICLFIFIFSSNAFSQNFSAKNGVLNLRDLDFSKNPTIELSGQWEFYWGKLYTPSDFETEVHTPDAYINVPGGWEKLTIDGKQLPDTGYATLRLVLFLPDTLQNDFSIEIPEVLTSYKLWFNDEVVAAIGKVGTTSETAIPMVRMLVNSVNLKSKKNEIIVQISNFHHRNSGFDSSPVFGKTESVIRDFSKKIAINLITFGLMLIMSFYHFGLFIMRRKNIAALAFSLLTFVLAVRTIITDTYILQFIFPTLMSWSFSYRLAYITFYTFIPLFVFFFQSTFEEKRYKWIFRTIYIISGIFLVTLFFNSLFFSKILFIYQIIVVLFILFSIFLLIKYLKEKKKGARVLFFSILILFVLGINDMLVYNDVIKSIILLPVGVFVLILGQSLTLARIFTNAFIENEKLTEKLNYQNEHLQELVKERTKEIERQKQDILQKNEELMVQKEELQVQKDAIVKQKEIIEEHAKLISDSIHYASSIQQSILPSTQNLKIYFDHFIVFMPKDVVSGDFYWFSDNHPQYMFFALGDCTGHGVPGAFLSLIASYLLSSIINEKHIVDLIEIMNTLDLKFNKFMHKTTSHNIDGMDISLLRFEKDNKKKVDFTGAKGSILVWYPSVKELKRYKAARRSIGFLSNSETKSRVKFFESTIELEEDSIIYLYSDGYVDQNNQARKRFGTLRFLKVVKENAEVPIQQQKIILIKQLEEYKEDSPQRDDITVIALRLK